MRFADGVSDLELADYQRAVRLLLRHPLITSTWPDDRALQRIRRFSPELRADLAEAFGYRLELHGSTARLVRTSDVLIADRPATARTGRPFDRQRYAYLALCLAVLGRAGIQVSLSELAESVTADANRIAGLGLDADRGADRRAFVDAVGWLEDRGALRVADGSTAAWASDPGTGEALYDIARDVVFAIFRPPRVLQHIDSVRALLVRSPARSGNEQRRAAAQAARRSVVESPIVYFGDMPDVVGNHLRGAAFAADVHRLTGLTVERRAEGVLLVDTAGLSTERFPGAGSVAQAAVLLIVEIADRVLDPDGRRVKRMAGPDLATRQAALADQLDAGLPRATTVLLDDQDPDLGQHLDSDEIQEEGQEDDARLPFITDSFLQQATVEILHQYGRAFGADWHADPDRLRTDAVALLARFGAILTIPGGVLVLPLAGRYRNTVARVRQRTLL